VDYQELEKVKLVPCHPPSLPPLLPALPTPAALGGTTSQPAAVGAAFMDDSAAAVGSAPTIVATNDYPQSTRIRANLINQGVENACPPKGCFDPLTLATPLPPSTPWALVAASLLVLVSLLLLLCLGVYMRTRYNNIKQKKYISSISTSTTREKEEQEEEPLYQVVKGEQESDHCYNHLDFLPAPYQELKPHYHSTSSNQSTNKQLIDKRTTNVQPINNSYRSNMYAPNMSSTIQPFNHQSTNILVNYNYPSANSTTSSTTSSTISSTTSSTTQSFMTANHTTRPPSPIPPIPFHKKIPFFLSPSLHPPPVTYKP
jgi:hypothetical protein